VDTVQAAGRAYVQWWWWKLTNQDQKGTSPRLGWGWGGGVGGEGVGVVSGVGVE